MAINSINNNALNNVANVTNNLNNVLLNNTQTTPQTQPNTANTPASEFVQSQGVDRSEINRLIRESQDQTRWFEQLISSMFNRQASNFRTAWNRGIGNQNLRDTLSDMLGQASADDIARAQELVSEDGFFGVRQTSERLLEFARAYAGNDVARIERMQAAFERGFANAERAWGGNLPEISHQTRDAVRRGFEEMLAAARGGATA